MTPASAENDRGQDSKSDDALRETFRRVALPQKSDASGPSGVPTLNAVLGLIRRWLLVVNLAFGVYSGLPWLATLTRGALPTWFYIGDALGSFTS